MQHSLCIKGTEEKCPQEFLNTATILFYKRQMPQPINSGEQLVSTASSHASVLARILIFPDRQLGGRRKFRRCSVVARLKASFGGFFKT